MGALPAQAAHVQCGDTITQDTTLDGDLVDCPGTGLVVGADLVTLDLNGHLVSTTGGRAIWVKSSSSVTVENGRTTAGGAGCDVVFEDSSDGHARALTADGLCAEQSERVEFEDSTLGVVTIFQSSGSIVRNVDARPTIVESSRVVVRDVRGAIAGGCGLFAHQVHESVFERVEGNTFCLTGGDANVLRRLRFTSICLVDHGNRNLVEDNSCSSLGLLSADDNTVVHNKFSGGNTGISIQDGDRNLIVDNALTGALANGIELFFADENHVERNRAFDNGVWGIFVSDLSSGSEGNVLVDNITHRNGKDGIEVREASTTLTGNLANRNGELGIAAVAGVIDGGGNKAHANADPAQCANVDCR